MDKCLLMRLLWVQSIFFFFKNSLRNSRCLNGIKVKQVLHKFAALCTAVNLLLHLETWLRPDWEYTISITPANWSRTGSHFVLMVFKNRHLFCFKDKHRDGEVKGRKIPSAGSLPKSLQLQGAGKAEAQNERTQPRSSHMGDRNPSGVFSAVPNVVP